MQCLSVLAQGDGRPSDSQGRRRPAEPWTAAEAIGENLSMGDERNKDWPSQLLFTLHTRNLQFVEWRTYYEDESIFAIALVNGQPCTYRKSIGLLIPWENRDALNVATLYEKIHWWLDSRVREMAVSGDLLPEIQSFCIELPQSDVIARIADPYPLPRP